MSWWWLLLPAIPALLFCTMIFARRVPIPGWTLDGKDLPITAYPEHWAARLIGSTFTMGRRHFHQHAMKKTLFSTAVHETGHTKQCEDAKGPDWGELGFLGKSGRSLRVGSFLGSYWGKALLRRVLPEELQPDDMYENQANAEESILLANKHPRLRWTDATRAVYG